MDVFTLRHSPKRDEGSFGEHFKLDDCRRWMRLHFWAARESGIFAHAGFADYYVVGGCASLMPLTLSLQSVMNAVDPD